MSIATQPTSEARSIAVRATLQDAQEIGVQAAIERHAGDLTPEDCQMISDLVPSEVDELLALSGQMSELDAVAMDTNNNL